MNPNVNPSRRASAWVIASIALGFATAMAAPGSAATPAVATATNRVLPYAGDSQVLVYGTRSFDKTLHNYGQVANRDIELRALTKSGKHVDLVNTGQAASAPVSVVGSVIAVFNPNNDGAAHVWDVADGKRFTSVLPAGEVFSGASPNGFVYYEKGQDREVHLYDETFAGQVKDLGTPTPPNPDPVYRFTVGPGGVIVADGEGNGPATEVPSYMKWSSPGKWHSLHRARAGGCSDLGNRYAACGPLIPLDGSKPIQPTHYHCTGVQIIFHDSMVRACASGRLHRNSATGEASVSRHAYADQGVVHAFNELIVSSPTQSRLETLTSINAKPKTLLSAS